MTHVQASRTVILAVALLATTWVAAAPQSSTSAGPAGSAGNAAERQRWAEQGFGPGEAKSWNNVGIDPAEARQWVRAGIQFAEWANQWKGAGFGPADARAWVEHQVNVYTAGDFRSAGFSSADATAWIERGVRSALRAKAFRDRGLGPVEAGEWWRLEFFPEDAAGWKQEGFSARDALAWKYGEKEYFYQRSGSRASSRQVYSVEWAKQWRATGLSPVEAHLAGAYGVASAEAAGWLAAGFHFEDAMAWRDSGFGPTDAAREKAAGLSPVDAEERRDIGSDRSSDVMTTLHSDIILRPDATVEVTETIGVTNGPAGPVKRCLSRVFPTTVALKRSMSSSTRAWPSYAFTSVLMDGGPAVYSVDKDASGDITLCLNGQGVPLPEGTYTFTLHYTTDDRLIDLHDRDQLVFDVKGPVPTLPIQRASAAVHLPKGANTVLADGFAGPRNRKYFVAEVKETADGDVIEYTVTRPLKSDMEFEVAVSLPKGFVQPSLWQKARRFDHRAAHVLSSLICFTTGLAAALVYFLWAWRRVGKDPKKGAVVPVYEPPEGISPALARYLVTRRRIDDKTVAATLVRLAHCGALVIREREGRYSIEKTGKSAESCTPHEREFLDRLFADSAADLTLGTGEARRRVRAAARTLRTALRAESVGYMAANTRYVWPGLAMSLVGAAFALAVVDESEMKVAYAYPLFVAAVTGSVDLTFWLLLKAPTLRGRKVCDDIEGLRRFLEASYQKTSAVHGTPSMDTPLARAAHLPYAIALGIDSERVSILDRRFTWYAGRSGGFSVADFTASLERMTPRAVRS